MIDWYSEFEVGGIDRNEFIVRKVTNSIVVSMGRVINIINRDPNKKVDYAKCDGKLKFSYSLLENDANISEREVIVVEADSTDKETLIKDAVDLARRNENTTIFLNVLDGQYGLNEVYKNIFSIRKRKSRQYNPIDDAELNAMLMMIRNQDNLIQDTQYNLITKNGFKHERYFDGDNEYLIVTHDDKIVMITEDDDIYVNENEFDRKHPHHWDLLKKVQKLIHVSDNT